MQALDNSEKMRKKSNTVKELKESIQKYKNELVISNEEKLKVENNMLQKERHLQAALVSKYELLYFIW